MAFPFRTILKIVALPLILLAFYLSLFVIWTAFDLPKDAALVEAITVYFNRYGLIIVFLGALIEGALLLGQYFPGGFIIVIGVLSAGKNIPRTIEVVAVVSIAFFIAYWFNYLVGKYGWYRLFLKFGLKGALERAQIKLQKHHLYAILASYWEPNVASITATAAGTLQLPLKEFLFFSAIGIVVWNTFWGTFVYLIGDQVFALAGFKYALLVFGIWMGILLVKYYFFDRKADLTED